MARPEDMLARGNARNGANYDQGFDEPQGAQRRDPRRPFDQQRGREEAPLRSGPPPQPVPPRGAGPSVTPQFDPYVSQQAAPRQAAPQGRPQMPPPQQQQAYSADPYAQPRNARPAAMPNQAPPTAGRPGQTQRPPAQGFAPQANYAPLQGQPARGQPAYDAVPPTGRVREPFFEAPPSARQPVPSRQPAGIAQDGYGEDPFTGQSQNEAAYDEDDADGETDEIEHEPAPRRRTGMYIGIALAAAVALGGGAGYLYKLGGGHRVIGATPPVVQADAAPVKVMADDAAAGAADPNKKTILERADGAADAAPPATVPSQETVAMAAGAPGDALASPRKVATVVVKPGEKIALGAAPAGNAQPVDAVPGLSVGDDTAAIEAIKPRAKATVKAVRAPVTQAVDAAMADTAATADPASQPVKLGKAAKKSVAAAAAPPADPAMATDAAADPAPADPTVTTPKVKTASAAPKAVGSGYLIQVRSTKTQQEALAYFADLQQRYGDLLGASQPDIQEADLGTKGLWYRLRIGPPGSSAAAHDLCVKLKTAGLKDCITAAY